MCAGRITASIGTLPAIDIPIGDAEHDSYMTNDCSVCCETIEQPGRQCAVVKSFSKKFGPGMQLLEVQPSLFDDNSRIRPLRRIMAAHPCPSIDIFMCRVFVRIMPG